MTVPCAAARVGEVMGRILRRTASAPSVIDYGFDASLGAREALRGQVYQEAAGTGRTGMARAVARLRDLAGLAGDPGAAARVLPRGLEGAVLAEVIGAAILHDGAAPEGEDRLAVERVVRDMSDARAWRRVLKRVPSTLPGAADDLAAAVAGRDGAARLLTPARILARGALTAQAMGEDRVAALFERGLGLYGKRAGAARLLGRPEDLVAPQRDRQMEFAWPDPGLRPERGRSAVIGPPRGQRRGAGVWISGGFWGMFRAPTQSWRSRFWRVWRECSGWGRGPAAPGARGMRRGAMQRGRRRNVPAVAGMRSVPGPGGMQHRLNRCQRQTGLWPRAARQYPGRSCMPVLRMQRQTWRRPCRTTLMANGKSSSGNGRLILTNM